MFLHGVDILVLCNIMQGADEGQASTVKYLPFSEKKHEIEKNLVHGRYNREVPQICWQYGVTGPKDRNHIISFQLITVMLAASLNNTSFRFVFVNLTIFHTRIPMKF